MTNNNNSILKNENKNYQKGNLEDGESSQIDVKSLQKNDSSPNEQSASSFIDPYISIKSGSSAKKVQDKYICEDEPVWSDPDISNKLDAKQDETQNEKQLFDDSQLNEKKFSQQIQEWRDKQERMDKQYEKYQTLNRLKTLNVQRKQQASINNFTFQQGQNQNSFQSKNEQQAVEDDDNCMLNATIKSQTCINDCQLQQYKNAIGKFVESHFNGSKENRNQNIILKFKKGETIGQYSFFYRILKQLVFEIYRIHKADDFKQAQFYGDCQKT
ncbi:hypothetical protein ABPG72_010556 [Tetrahymena utriculariae]